MAFSDKAEARVRSMLGGTGSASAVKPDVEIEIDPEQMTLESAGEEMIQAVKAGDSQAVARAFRAMFEALIDSGPEDHNDD